VKRLTAEDWCDINIKQAKIMQFVVGVLPEILSDSDKSLVVSVSTFTRRLVPENCHSSLS
jgi:hypothetical protein